MTQGTEPNCASKLALIPEPKRCTPREEECFVLNDTVVIVAAERCIATARGLQELLKKSTGFTLRIDSDESRLGAGSSIRLELAETGRGEESYQLDVSSQRVLIKAPTCAGLFYGVQTLLQLCPPAIYNNGPRVNLEWTIPGVEIEDWPDLRWRGLMLDSARYFQPVDFIYKWIDLLAQHKFNTFHWHLTDDQGWRVEIKKYPKLTEIGAWRKETVRGHISANPSREGNGVPHGGFYTQDQLREIVAYAQQRNVTIIPEIEMPGHAQSAVASYPELGLCEGEIAVSTKWGVHTTLYNVREATFAFLQDVLDEVMDIFPSRYIHIGGDEAKKDQWLASDEIAQAMQVEGIEDVDQLQSWFVGRINRYLQSKGRRLIGWDEIIEGGLTPGATVMSWRGEAGGVTAAQSGHDVVMAPHNRTYFDYYQAENIADEPLAIGGYINLKSVYDYNPIPAELSAEESERVLGVQGQLWTEYIGDSLHLEYMTFPRACALAEVAWGRRHNDYSSFEKRLRRHLLRLNCQGVRYRPLDT